MYDNSTATSVPKAVDAWWTVLVVDPFAMRVLPLLLRVPGATPNVVTGAAFVAGLGAIAAFALSHWVIGALLYELRFVLDCLDGKIARARSLSSPVGAAFDRLSDSIAVPVVFATIGLRLAADGHLPDRLALVAALGCAMVGMVEVVLEMERKDRPAVLARADRRVTAWMRRHRLTLRPWTVELETLGLFLGPLLLRRGPLAVLELGVAVAYAACLAVQTTMVLREAGHGAS